MEDGFFKRDRTCEAVHRLGERLGEVKRQEEEARRLADYNAALVERDRLAAELVEVYPSFVEMLADLVSRIAVQMMPRSTASIENCPVGRSGLANAELVARQLKSFFDGTADIPRIAKHCGFRRSSTSASARTRGRAE
jgi:hypothetical protein